jgi:RNase_H superfamily
VPTRLPFIVNGPSDLGTHQANSRLSLGEAEGTDRASFSPPAAADELLRRRVFVDLNGITRQAVRAGVESYGLKGIETVYRFQRNPQLQNAVGSLSRWQRYLERRDRKLLDDIALYNRDDCLSTRALYEWLRARRPDVEARFGIVIDDLAPEPAREPSDRQRELLRRTEALRATLLAGLPDNESDDTPDQRPRRLMFLLTGYHIRGAKPAWWAYFERRNKTAEELMDEDSEAIGMLTEMSREASGFALLMSR